MIWQQTHSDGHARLGTLKLSKTHVETPIFMPVGTKATVKALDSYDLESIGYRLMLVNTFHTNIEPGMDTIKHFGDIKSFMNWPHACLSDSGGFQVFSLSQDIQYTPEGVIIKSPKDGSSIPLSCQDVMGIQKQLGVDIAMVLDDCPAHPATPHRLRESLDRTIKWAKICREFPLHQHQNLFAIIQGGMQLELRQYCIDQLCQLPFEGFALGGLSVGESMEEMEHVLTHTTHRLPQEKPRYLMGVGKPENIIQAVDTGIDMFDCVLPTRNARNGSLFTWDGAIQIKKAQYRFQDTPIDSQCPCWTCQNYSLGYLHHLFRSKELTSYRLNSIHNLTFYFLLMKKIRNAIMNQQWDSFKKDFLKQYK